MFEIKELSDVRGNNVIIYSMKTLLERKAFPHLSILAGVMGVGKTSVANVIARELDKSGMPIKTYNFGMSLDLKKLQEEVFSLNPAKPRAFIFEELHGLPKNDQNALLQLFDSQSKNVYIICTTTESYKILRTIKSRAQVWEFKLLSEKQCAQLLEDYLAMKNVKMSPQSKFSLLKSCHGVPRDLIKNVDFALDGNFNASQLDALLGNVSDEFTFALFCALKSKTPDFVCHIEDLLDESAENRIDALRDFWLRFLLERHKGARQTLSPEMINGLNNMYDDKDIAKVTKTILKSNPDTLALELINLNMSLTSTSGSDVLGYQKEAATRAEKENRFYTQQNQEAPKQVRLTGEAIKKFEL